MKTNRLSTTINTALNNQMQKEAQAAQIYLSYASWAANEGYEGIAHFLFHHAGEERKHMMKFLYYILERGSRVHVEAIPAPPADPETVEDCFERAFQHEVDNSNSIYKIVKMSFDEDDWATWNFMQWFIHEQTEEETLILRMLDKLKIIGGAKASKESLYAFDRELATAPGEVKLA